MWVERCAMRLAYPLVLLLRGAGLHLSVDQIDAATTRHWLGR